ncbi:hypothetical protein [Colwellia piezophila]|uniref:hypothetical protein n=1 Tax=Colwellia piezophila TaxID=211668 RepID=UPI00036B0C6A|nr:hypothetical protein [Colwellia piezophila]
MNKYTLAAAIIASLGATIMPVYAVDIDPAAQTIIDNAVATVCSPSGCDLNATLTAAIAANPALAESLVAAAIAVVGADSEEAETLVATAIAAVGIDSPLVAGILTAATEAGVDADTVTGIAIATGVDATLASQATAAGPAATPVAAPAPRLAPTPPANGGGSVVPISPNT